MSIPEIEIESNSTDTLMQFDTNDLGSLYVVGSGSQNILRIIPAANGSYANSLVQYQGPADFGGTALPGRQVYEIANTTTYDANGDILGTWRPTHIISGPKDSIFVACDTGYDPNRNPSVAGVDSYSDSVYCYHVVVSQNVATGAYSTKNVYPVFSNTGSRYLSGSIETLNVVGQQQSCAGLALDNEDPPNLYYMSSNTVFRIQPKGYSYHQGDTDIEQIFPDKYFTEKLNWPLTQPGLGWYKFNTLDNESVHIYDSNYMHIKVDSRNRLFFGGAANLYCYSRGTNNAIIVYNQSNTEFSTLNVVANTSMYTANISWDMGTGSSSIGIDDFQLGARTTNSAFLRANSFSEGVYFTIHAHDGIDTDDQINPRQLCVVYPNANGSFVHDSAALPETQGQYAQTLLYTDPTAVQRFETKGSTGANKYRGQGPAKIALRPEKR